MTKKHRRDRESGKPRIWEYSPCPSTEVTMGVFCLFHIERNQLVAVVAEPKEHGRRNHLKCTGAGHQDVVREWLQHVGLDQARWQEYRCVYSPVIPYEAVTESWDTFIASVQQT